MQLKVQCVIAEPGWGSLSFPDYPRELCVPRSDADWYRLPHTQWRWPGCHLYWSGRSWCCGCYGWDPMGAQVSQSEFLASFGILWFDVIKILWSITFHPCFYHCFLQWLSLFLYILSVFSSGDWSAADRHSVRLDFSQRRHPEGGWNPDCEGRHWGHRGVPRAWSRLHLMHWWGLNTSHDALWVLMEAADSQTVIKPCCRLKCLFKLP